MSTVSRRTVLTSLGWVGGTAMGVGGTPMQMTSLSSAMASPLGWVYVPLDAREVGDRAYRIYPEGGCMYAVVGSVVGTLADRFGSPYDAFPIAMMRFGEGGVGGYGSLCGVVNGACALIGLFHSERPKEERAAMISDLAGWYESSVLPEFKPGEPEWADEAIPCVSGSVLCHISTTRWCRESGCPIDSLDRKERCRRLAADGAMKVVRMLNHESLRSEILAARQTNGFSCMECHGPDDMSNARVKMDCAACHDLSDGHP
ncbi:C-GCAxxG-C-C family protein [Crateriforma conspicua]|uniref:C-GCAxxG-C-C family protein n=1 Tax=Crateriforma conspicua TaxID=2527996 RepID=UPI00118D0283|nr:C-GCAxxG-C-C family protein [Crateriforma conspicua]QDV63853.1 Split-Soret cytochrome c precursor [Crateriforma conspicua]